MSENHSHDKVPYIQNPIDQPGYVHHQPAAHSPIYPITGIPQPTNYSTNLDPVFVQHISRHQGQKIALVTTAGRVEGEVAGVAVDHVQINLDDRALHIRLSQVIWFEGPLASYRENNE
ncbi:DUF2642 domain-containing protein [Metabacillus endolithicus]|uniref:DUF2642 domain-containing protein n=1 Tax=Metabacillus endolithicus TaxID=1535204 RepID=A0ABW5C3F6_9BACI|nr:DUF2642 domain-containing protein [Metabacillus endolithicus]UPG64950.1 YuzF family protein [Metabacillus endolithicus]